MLSKGGGRGHNQAMDFDRRAPNSPNLFPRHGGPKRAGATAALEGENRIEKRQSTGKIVSPGARSCFLFFNFSIFQFSQFFQFFNFSIFQFFQFFNFSFFHFFNIFNFSSFNFGRKLKRLQAGFRIF